MLVLCSVSMSFSCVLNRHIARLPRRAVALYPRTCSSQLISDDREGRPRGEAFYTQQAVERHYFYYMDTRGQVFLEETMPRNIATCMKDIKFLNFLIRNMKPNGTDFYPDIPFISLCGKEINFISPADRFSSLCFKDIAWATSQLTYGGSLEQEFRPELLAYNPETGRIYHRILNHKYLAGSYGLLHPHICQKLGDRIAAPHATPTHSTSTTRTISSDGAQELVNEVGDGVSTGGSRNARYVLEWNGQVYPLEDAQTTADANSQT